MAWIYVLLAGVVEILWVLGLKHSETLLQWTGTTIAIIASFYLIIKASEQLPVGTVYAVFTGMGTAGIVTIDIVLFGEPFSLIKCLFIALILFGVIGIKIITNKEEQIAQKSNA